MPPEKAPRRQRPALIFLWGQRGRAAAGRPRPSWLPSNTETTISSRSAALETISPLRSGADRSRGGAEGTGSPRPLRLLCRHSLPFCRPAAFKHQPPPLPPGNAGPAASAAGSAPHTAPAPPRHRPTRSPGTAPAPPHTQPRYRPGAATHTAPHTATHSAPAPPHTQLRHCHLVGPGTGPAPSRHRPGPAPAHGQRASGCAVPRNVRQQRGAVVETLTNKSIKKVFRKQSALPVEERQLLQIHAFYQSEEVYVLFSPPLWWVSEQENLNPVVVKCSCALLS